MTVRPSGHESPGLIPRVYYPEDIVDGKINYAKLLAESDIVPLLELTEEQLGQFKTVANEFFELRREISEQRLEEFKSSRLTGEERKAAFRKATVLGIEDPFDVDSRLGEFLLPHQMEVVRTGIPLRFFLGSLEGNSRGNQQSPVSENVSALLGVSKENAKAIVGRINKIQNSLKDDIREVIYEEIRSSIDILSEEQRTAISELLQLNPRRTELLDVSNLESLIARRVAWKRNKRTRLQISARSAYKLTTDAEQQWLELTDEQENQIKSLLKSINNEKIKSASSSGGSKLSFSFKGSRNDQKKLANNRTKLNELYDSVSEVLLPEQVEELKVLDRWRLLNVRPFELLLTSEEINFNKTRFDADYRKILELSIEKLKEIRRLQQEKFIATLPRNWQKKLENRLYSDE